MEDNTDSSIVYRSSVLKAISSPPVNVAVPTLTPPVNPAVLTLTPPVNLAVPTSTHPVNLAVPIVTPTVINLAVPTSVPAVNPAVLTSAPQVSLAVPTTFPHVCRSTLSPPVPVDQSTLNLSKSISSSLHESSLVQVYWLPHQSYSNKENKS